MIEIQKQTQSELYNQLGNTEKRFADFLISHQYGVSFSKIDDDNTIYGEVIGRTRTGYVISFGCHPFCVEDVCQVSEEFLFSEEWYKQNCKYAIEMRNLWRLMEFIDEIKAFDRKFSCILDLWFKENE